MKTCHCCTAQLEDNARFCRNCGAVQPDVPEPPVPVFPAAPEEPSPWDHTGEFEAEDIARGKLYAMLVYLLGIAGILLALVGARDSAYAAFHIRQGLKLTVLEALLVLAAAVLFWTFLVPIAAAVCLGLLLALKAICFFRVCGGRAVEPPVVRKLGFLN